MPKAGLITRRVAAYGAALSATLALCAWTAWRDMGSPALPSPSPLPLQMPSSSRPAAVVRAAPVISVAVPAIPAPAPVVDRDRLVDAVADPFAPVSFLPPPPPPPPVPRTVAPVPLAAPAPVAPAFPFRYVGRMTGVDGSTAVYLASDQQLLAVRAGQLLAGGFRIDAIDEQQIALTYMPLDQHTVLATPTAAR